MTVLIDGATEDTESAVVDASGPIIVSVLGTMKDGMVRITANLGSGEANIFTYYPGDPVAVARLELASGISFKGYVEGTSHADTDITVEYVAVS